MDFKDAMITAKHICERQLHCSTSCPLWDNERRSCLVLPDYETKVHIDKALQVLQEYRDKHYLNYLDSYRQDAGGIDATRVCYYNCPGEFMVGPCCTSEKKKEHQKDGTCFRCWLRKRWVIDDD